MDQPPKGLIPYTCTCTTSLNILPEIPGVFASAELLSLSSRELLVQSCDRSEENAEDDVGSRKVSDNEKAQSSSKEWSCRFCSEVFDTKSARARHENALHDERADHDSKMCRYCGHTFRKRSGRLEHELTVHTSEIYASKEEEVMLLKVKLEDYKAAGRVFKSLSSTLQHQRNCKQQPAAHDWKCRFCSEVFDTKRARADHEYGLHDEMADHESKMCRYCGKEFRKRVARLEHELMVHMSEISSSVQSEAKLLKVKLEDYRAAGRVCNHCDKYFTSSAKLDHHKKNCGGSQKVSDNEKAQSSSKEWSCRFCSEVFDTKRARAHHEYGRHDERADHESKMCRYCGKEFRKRVARIEHELMVHMSEISSSVQSEANAKLLKVKLEDYRAAGRVCNHCDKIFTSSTKLDHHKKNCTTDKQSDKQQSPAERKWKWRFRKSDRINNKCRFCDQKFKRPVNCREHELNVHQDEILQEPVKYRELKLAEVFMDTSRHKDLESRFQGKHRAGLVCKCCHHGFYSRSRKEKHERKMQLKKMVCRFCGFQAFSDSQCLSHELSEHSAEVQRDQHKYPDLMNELEQKRLAGLVCSCCSKIHDTSVDTITHEKWMEELKNRWLCQWCGITYKTKGTLEKHCFRKHRNEPLPALKHAAFQHAFDPKDCSCRWCKKEFTNPFICESHEDKFHSQESDYVPRFATWSTQEKKKLKQECLKQNPHSCKCQWCHTVFESKWDLRRHQFYFHRTEPDYSETSAFIAKMSWQTDPENCLCRWCGKNFQNVYNLSQHEKEFHSEESDFVGILQVLPPRKLKKEHKRKLRNKNKKLERFKCESMTPCAADENLRETHQIHHPESEPESANFENVDHLTEAHLILYEYEPKPQVIATEIKKLKQTFSGSRQNSRNAATPAPAKRRTYGQCSSLLEWKDHLNDVLISYFNGQTKPEVQFRPCMMNFSRSAVPRKLLEAGFHNLSLFDATHLDTIQPEWAGYDCAKDMENRVGMHQISLGRLAANWAFYEETGAKNHFDCFLSGSNVSWDLFNWSQVPTDTAIVGFLHQERFHRYLMKEVIHGSMQRCRMFRHGPVSLLTFLSPRMYGVLRGSPTATFLRKLTQWNIHMAMEMKLIHEEPLDSFRPKIKWPLLRKPESELLKMGGINPEKVYLVEFTPKRDSDLQLCGEPLRREDGVGLLFFQDLLARGMNSDGHTRTASHIIQTWFPWSVRELVSLGLGNKPVLHYTQQDLAVIFRSIVLPHIRANTNNVDDAFLNEYHRFLCGEVLHKGVPEQDQADHTTGRMKVKRLR